MKETTIKSAKTAVTITTVLTFFAAGFRKLCHGESERILSDSDSGEYHSSAVGDPAVQAKRDQFEKGKSRRRKRSEGTSFSDLRHWRRLSR